MSSSSKIRNILQSVQEREITKTAPDMVVYIEGLPFIMNPYLQQGGKDTPVNFNDYVTAISTSNSIDSFIPTGSINLSVPNGFKHLFTAPGGNTIIDLMSSVRIYAKSYFFSAKGNTVYRRIFNGLIKSVDLNELTTGLEIAIGICGICRIMELTQIELNKGLMSESSSELTVFRSNQAGLTVYGAIYDTFERDLDFSEFIKSSLLQDAVRGSRDAEALKKQYIARWSMRLQDLRKDVRLFGVKGTKEIVDPLSDVEPINKKEDRAVKDKPRPPKKNESITVKENAGVISLLQKYHFDMAMGGVKLMGGQLTSRIERVRTLVELAGLEGYQDVDGLIIVKPPLYNLDCTVVGKDMKDLRDENLYENANPYIIHMAEVLSENYSEDETAIRRTSMVLTSNFGSAGGIQIEGQIEISPTVRYVDIGLIRKFGVREEPPKYFGFLTNDKMANYAFAVCELNKANRGFRTYHVTIPLRPEIRLGFPIYIPHRDMYAYITSAAMSYNVGGQATTSLTCNFVRKRPLLQQEQTIETKNAEGKTEASKVTVYASQPNLIHAWVKGDGAPSTFTSKGSASTLKQVGNPSSTVPLKSEEPSQDQKAVYYYRTKKMGELFETWVDNGAAKGSWRIQNDDKKLGAVPQPPNGATPLDQGHWYNGVVIEKDGTGVRTQPKTVGPDYLHRSVMAQPYTDEKGYEVIPLLPWGRYSTLSEALTDTTRNYWYKEKEGTSQDKIGEQFAKTSAFLMAGLALPSGKSAADIQTELDKNKKRLEDSQANVTTATIGPSQANAIGPTTATIGPSQANANLNAVSAAQSSVDASQSELATASKQANSMSEVKDQFERFDKSNLISFELEYGDNDLGKSETDFANSSVPAGQQDWGNSVDAARTADPVAASTNFVDKLLVNLQGFLGPENSMNIGPYAVSTDPQNTDIGGYRPPAGPLSGVLLSMAATFVSSPYGDIFGLRPPKKSASSYFTSGYEDKRNIG